MITFEWINPISGEQSENQCKSNFSTERLLFFTHHTTVSQTRLITFIEAKNPKYHLVDFKIYHQSSYIKEIPAGKIISIGDLNSKFSFRKK